MAVALLVCGLTLVSFCGCATPAVVDSLDVMPFPGTPNASPQTQITFPKLAPGDFKVVSVYGSRSGLHAGRLTILSNDLGTAFVPDLPFEDGEHVTVDAVLGSKAAGTTIGAQGATRVTFGFKVAASASNTTSTTAPAATANGQAAQQIPTQSFHSRPDLQPPVVTVSQPDTSAQPGYVFVDAQMATQNGPMILDGQGRLVWFQPVPDGEFALDVKVQTYKGEPVITWWQGQVIAGHGLGEVVIADDSYRIIATVQAEAGYQADLHEFLITDRDTALITVYEPVDINLSSIGGPSKGTVYDSIVQEIDIETGEVLWEWHALGHVPLSASYVGTPTAGSAYDFFHINSIAETPEGNLIISARNTWAVYEIDRRTGDVIWQLGGKGSSFQMGPGTQFEWQHDARLLPDGSISLFDDAASPKEETESRAIRISLDTNGMAATLVSSETHPAPLLAGSQGSMQFLSNGDIFVGWGDQGYFSEFAPDGTLIFDANLPPPVQSYRAYRYAWTGRPLGAPSVSLTAVGGESLAVYASWNGATEVAKWELLAGNTPNDLSSQITVNASGFETTIPAVTSLPYLMVRALDSSGRVLGETSVPR